MPAQMQGDEQLLVRFYSAVNTTANPPKDEEWISIRTPASSDEYVARAHSVSHTDEMDNTPYTYAQRFAGHYGVFIKGGSDVEARREDLRKQLAALDAKAAEAPAVTKNAMDAADKAAKAAMAEDANAVRLTATQAAKAKG